MEKTLELLSNALPEKFSFYHLGEITLAPKDEKTALPSNLQDHVALGFTLQGDWQAALVLIFDRGLDLSTYSEAGNIVASKLVTRLSQEHGVDLVLSPPTEIEEKQLGLLEKNSLNSAMRIYFHSYGKNLIPVQTWIFTGPGRQA